MQPSKTAGAESLKALIKNMTIEMKAASSAFQAAMASHLLSGHPDLIEGDDEMDNFYRNWD